MKTLLILLFVVLNLYIFFTGIGAIRKKIKPYRDRFLYYLLKKMGFNPENMGFYRHLEKDEVTAFVYLQNNTNASVNEKNDKSLPIEGGEISEH